jgi:UDP-2,3-diacylglucosamine pyrophosphatase LpxH
VRHTVAISDIHLSEVERTSGLWMRYRQEKYAPGPAIAEMVAKLLARIAEGDELALVLNGDIFDFDAPRVVAGESMFHDQPRDAVHAAPMIEAILRDHGAFVGALASVLAKGHEICFVSGNHDVQLTLPEVRAVVAARLVDAVRAIAPDMSEASVRARVHFRAWFYLTRDGILFEHGNQYDSYCSFRYPMAPFGKKPAEIQPTMGSLATRNLVSRMGYFNPHVDDSYMLGVVGYLHHWAKYYLFSRRSLAFAWAVGAFRTLRELTVRRDPSSKSRRRANVTAAALENGVPLRHVARHARLFARPAEDELGKVARELWVDRVLLGGFTLALAALWALLTHGAWRSGALAVPGLMLFYELFVPKGSLEETWKKVDRYARRVGAVHRARAVVFGHTHKATGAWENGVFYGNTGSWSAAYLDLECTRLATEARPLVWLKSGVDGRPELLGGLVTYRDGTFIEPPADAESSGQFLGQLAPAGPAAES